MKDRDASEYNDQMPENAAKTEELPPEAQIVEMVMAQFVSRLIHLTATLKLPDYLADRSEPAVGLDHEFS